MEVKLAGFNIDTDEINEMADPTPETISAAYARISRSSDDVTTLRRKAREDVKKARKSNENIVFNMGHHSIAEHAVLNFDIVGISRLAVEVLQHFRLNSYTEKSQRYVKFNKGYYTPQEINEDDKLCPRYNAIINKCFDIYTSMVDDGIPEEDVRYILPLSTETQLGMTINARNLELMLRRFAAHPLNEIRLLGNMLYKLAYRVIPSLIIFNESGTYNKDAYKHEKWCSNLIHREINMGDGQMPVEHVQFPTHDTDTIITAGLLSTCLPISFEECFEIAKSLSTDELAYFYRLVFKDIQFHNSVPREFECAYFTSSLIMSASCFAQMKRHRMATILPQDYNIRLGVTVPDSIKDSKYIEQFNNIIDGINSLYAILPVDINTYILSNAHRRRVIATMNMREFYHFVRLRCDEHSQWEIRTIADGILERVKKEAPYTAMLACGKHKFEDTYNSTFL